MPTRNSVRKHAVVDGTTRFIRSTGSHQILPAGARIRLRWHITAHLNTPLCGERGDRFVVSMRIATGGKARVVTRPSGYRDLLKGLWMVRHSEPCSHQILEDEDYVLQPNCQAVSDGIGALETLPPAKVTIFLTANNIAARRAALVAFWYYWNRIIVSPETSYLREIPELEVFLRGRATCISCAVKQTLVFPRSFLVL